MKKFAFWSIVLLGFGVFASCKKDSKGESYHITCKINGETQTFNNYIIGGNLTTGDAMGFVIGGSSKSTEDSDGFGVIITDPEQQKAVTAGTYTDQDTDFQVLATYHHNATNTDYDAGYEMNNDAENYNIPIANHFIFTITALDGNTARGTFSGDFFPNGDLEGAKKTITEGSFYVKLTNE